MENNKTNYNKTEFLFECDEDKVLLKKALNSSTKTSLSHKIFLSGILITVFLSMSLFLLNNYKVNKISKIKGLISNTKNEIINIEKTNIYSKNLLKIEKKFDKYSITVNKANPISEDDLKNYDLVTVKDNSYYGIKLEKETYFNYLKLKKELSKRGYNINIISGYISFDLSSMIYNSSLDKTFIPNKGQTEHNLGLSFDFKLLDNNYNSDEYKYLENILYLYGFIIRYPKGKEKVTGYDYNPYHIRYVGKKLAKYLRKNNLTLEEYYSSS